MSLSLWIITYLVVLLFWLWVALWGGAERIEGSTIAALFFHWLPRYDAESIKLIGWLAIVGVSAWFVAGLFVPAVRFWW